MTQLSKTELINSGLPQPTWSLLDSSLNAILRYCESMDDVRVIAQLAMGFDEQAWLELRHKYSDLINNPARIDGEQKYFDVVYWSAHKLKLVRDLGLDRKPSRRVLDLGTGVGHFMAMANFFGNECIGIDVDFPMYGDLAKLMNVRREIVPVMRHQPMSSFGGKFDLVTAIWISFNSYYTPGERNMMVRNYWTPNDWAFLLNDLVANHLHFPGRIYFVLNQNQSADGSYAFDPALFDWFESQGAMVDRNLGNIDLRLDTPRSFAG